VIALIDYGMGNLRSVQKAFEACGSMPKITSSAADVEKADKIILPGVGAFGQAMHELRKMKLLEALKNKIKSGTPYLGLCLGLQLLFTRSEEGDAKGLDILPGLVQRFPAKSKLKVPHMGWNTLLIRQKECPLVEGVRASDYFYFVHSYYAVPEEKDVILSTTDYGREFCSSIWRDNVFATQFHPEKSQEAGLRLVKNFIAYEGVGIGST
jgi:glutamine amidotransferase